MTSKLWGAWAVCGVLAAAVPAAAHHAVQAQYDFDKPIEFTGKLVKMEWISPHSMLHLEVTNKDGTKTEWLFQTTSPTTLRQRGLARSSEGGFEVGKTYTALGFAARSGRPMGFLREIGMPDGRRIVMWFGDPNGN
jgi:Family of unknown function (DUF6152)